jgi:hypothetical protein
VPDAALLHKLKGFLDGIVQGQCLDVIRHNVFDGAHESKKDIFACAHIIDQVDEPESVIGHTIRFPLDMWQIVSISRTAYRAGNWSLHNQIAPNDYSSLILLSFIGKGIQ